MKSILITALVCVVASVFGTAMADEKHAEEHAAMEKEHRDAVMDHAKWQKEIGRYRVEHLKALALLAKLQAHVLDHQAHVEEHAENIRIHDRHIRLHAREIAEHEAGGEGKEHAELAESHKHMLEDHQKMAKEHDTLDVKHDELMKVLQQIVKSLHGHDTADKKE